MTVNVESQILSTTAGRVEACVMGDGRPVLLVHGTLGNWRQMLALGSDLSSGHAAILVSRPGYGRTPLETGRSYCEQAVAFAALLDVLGFDRVAIIGVSAGAPSCVEFATKFPERTSALVLCGALAPQIASTRGMWASSIPGVVRIWASLESRRRAAAARRTDVVERYLWRDLSVLERIRAQEAAVSRDLSDFVRWTAAGPSGVGGLENDIANIRRSHKQPPATDVHVATLVLHGADDRFVPIDHGRYYASAIPGALIELTPGGGHLFLQAFRVATSERIGRFLDAHR